MAKGKYEAELETAASASSDWELAGLPALLEALSTLEGTMKKIASDLGFKGNTGDAAQQQFVGMQTDFQTLITSLTGIQKAVDHENTSRKSFAEDALKALPSTAIEPWVVIAVAAGAPFVFPGILAPVAAATAITTIQNHLDQQRENVAKTWVTSMTDAYDNAKIPGVPNSDPNSGSGGGSTKAYTSGTGGTPANLKWPTSKATDLQGGGKAGLGGPNVDGPGLGTDPGGYPPPPGSLGGGSGGGLSGSGGLGGGGTVGDPLTGAGTGGLAAGAAGIAALGASRLGGAAGGLGGLAGAGAGSGTTPGSGGLLGSSAKAASAAAAEESEGAAGAKPGTSMMGSPGGSGSRGKEKRAGLGGFIAPKLEDEEERGPRSASALAGSRDNTTDEA